MRTPTLQTQRLLLTPFGSYPNDVADVQRNINHPDIAKFLTIPWPYPEGGAQYFIKSLQEKMEAGDAIAWGIRLKSNPDECIGNIDYRLKKDEAPNTWGRGFWLALEHHRKGLMSEAVLETMHWMFDNAEMEILKTESFQGNTASYRIKAKMGFVHVGYLSEENCPIRKGETIKSDCWELTRERWEKFLSGSVDLGESRPEF